jgi:hypothetical protein
MHARAPMTRRILVARTRDRAPASPAMMARATIACARNRAIPHRVSADALCGTVVNSSAA